MNKEVSKSLSELLDGIVPFDSKMERIITGLSEDSRYVSTGNLFFARRGIKKDGREFIASAIEKGAAVVLVEADNKPGTAHTNGNNVPIIAVKDLAQVIGLIAARFYDDPSKDLKIIGITGTNGKTTCAHFIAQGLHLSGENCGIIGTLGNGFYQQLQPGSHTTPDAIAIQRLLAEFRNQGAKYVAIEVTSHALTQGRVNGVDIDIAVLTNLTRDHLDYHGNIASYAAAKRSLFSKPGVQYAILNADDEFGRQWMDELTDKMPVFSYSLSSHQPESVALNNHKIYVHHAQLDTNGITASLHTPWGDGVLHNPKLTGRFNLSNLLAVVGVLGILGIPLETILSRMAELRGVPGRMETFGGGTQPLVVIDFAHTPDALEQVLQALVEYKQGTLWCVFGCGGDRDRGKRPLMGKIAEQYADQLVITDDNPRHEDPRQIVTEIFQGLEQPNKAVIEHDRRRAIEHAISCAQPNDVVLVAGKGHETYQIIGDNKEPFNDALEVQKILFPT